MREAGGTELEDYASFIKVVFDSYKCKSREDLLHCIPIYDDEDLICGYLRPITADFHSTLPGISALIAQWRNENPTLSAQSFLATEEGSKAWLDTLVIDRDDRLLFLILALDGTRIGHIGFSSFDYEERCCEVDAVLRGEKSVYPGMMAFALRALVNWGLCVLRLDTIQLRVFQDNSHAIRFYQRNGFLIEKQEEPSEENTGKLHTVMRLDLDNWQFT